MLTKESIKLKESRSMEGGRTVVVTAGLEDWSHGGMSQYKEEIEQRVQALAWREIYGDLEIQLERVRHEIGILRFTPDKDTFETELKNVNRELTNLINKIKNPF